MLTTLASCEVDGRHYPEFEQPIRMREKHYELVQYTLNEINVGVRSRARELKMYLTNEI